MFLKATKTYAFLIKRTSKNNSISLRHRLKKDPFKESGKESEKNLLNFSQFLKIFLEIFGNRIFK